MLARPERFRLITAGQTYVPVLIVDSDVLLVQRRLRTGELLCPSCGAVLAPRGHGRPREIRGDRGVRRFVRPRRSRCTGCQVTHVLLPEALRTRQLDAAEVIGAGRSPR
ncbi:DUF6431 domain-containing protein [Streptomyces sp. NBC_00094]|uniref:DUF6431 domain-containing protein n=1 Tax=Streptomyces sp. NBC_00094 TaxID=2903620 RepID=UPI00338DAD4D